MKACTKFTVLPTLLATLAFSATTSAEIGFSHNQQEVVFPPGCSHTDIEFPYTLTNAGFDESVITVSSDSDWAIPSVDTAADTINIQFDSEDLIASYTATILVNDGVNSHELFVQATVPPMNVYRLLDDPTRSVTYGIMQNGEGKGSILAFDPIQETLTSCVTAGNKPTDFVISDDSSELFVINSADQSIDVIALDTFTLSETILLPVYSSYDSDTSANIELGPEGIIYYIDSSWGPALHVYQRSTGEVIQSLIFNGSNPTNDTGFMDFAVTSDKAHMVAMPQYGWSAGGHSSIIGQYSINADGTINFVKTFSLSGLERLPFEAPVLLSDDDQIAIMKTIATDPENIDNLDRVFPSAIWSMSPNGNVVATGDKIYDYDTGEELLTIPGARLSSSWDLYTHAQAFTSDYTRFVYFNPDNRTLNVINLIDEIGLDILGRTLTPADGAVVNTPSHLTWTPLAGIEQYDLYLCADNVAIETADHQSDCYIGRITGSSYELLQTLSNGTEYFWRVDPVTSTGAQTGSIYSFIVSSIELDRTAIDAQTVAGHTNYQTELQLTALDAEADWRVASENDWISFNQSTGTTPSTLTVQLDATLLAAGIHEGTIVLTTEDGPLNIPVELQVDALNITHIRSDRNSASFYAISENNSSIVSQAYLLEIDSETESIQRVTTVGNSVTDFTIHYADEVIYVTNWASGQLLEIDIETFEQTRALAFRPAGATGYSEGDVYRVSAGVSQRIVVEEQDQWIDISLYNTNSEASVSQAFVREGGGAHDPTGRYYYHGENNSSGASIIKFDTAGDVFTNLAEVRPEEIASYYGSRTVVVSEDGSRIFWSGVVFDADLNTEWGLGSIIYSTSADGRYAMGESGIYDVNLRRQILALPTTTRVSGYNATSKKLLVQVQDKLAFYSLTPPLTMPAPVLSADTSTSTSIELNWTDESLETGFNIQQRLLGESQWQDIYTTGPNTTVWTASNLQSGSSYEFRVKASATDTSSAWSNIVVKRENDVIDVLGRSMSPLNGSISLPPDTLSWTLIPWIEEYDVYLCQNEADALAADLESSCYQGRVSGAELALLQSLSVGQTYYWRIDPVTQEGPQTGTVQSFTVSDISLDKSAISASTFTGHPDYQVSISLSSAGEGVAWQARASDNWISFSQSSGTTPDTLILHLDASHLSQGTYSSSVILTSAENQVTIPVTFDVQPLNLKHIRSDRASTLMYAISEDNSSGAEAYLLEIDSLSETILRVLPVGSSVTDMAIHYADNLLYVTNWRSGELLAIDRDSLTLVNTHTFEPAGATGYSYGDVYRIAAGASERLVVEEEDQWVDIDIYNTRTETVLSSASVREGGGAFGPNGRYYYHGENNSSGADIIKYDTAGDVFTTITSRRPSEMTSYYGSRTVIVSEDGSRIFWSGVALDENLETIWAPGEIIYSTSANGQYAFGASSIFDIDKQQQVMAMPTVTNVSGYNSSTEKLLVQVDGALRFFSISESPELPAPFLSAGYSVYGLTQLTWTDNSLEMAFIIQRRAAGVDQWEDIETVSANSTQWTVDTYNQENRYEFRVRAVAGDISSPWSNVVRSKGLSVAYDYDGDGYSDFAVRRPGNTTWYIRNSSGIDLLSLNSDGLTRQQFGLRNTDIPVSADYDGDGITDLAIRRPETQTWYILNSSGVDHISGNSDGITRKRFGTSASDIPVPADYDGDGKADIAVRRPGTAYWYVLNSSGVDPTGNHNDGITRVKFGSQSEDIPVVADYDGDGRADFAVRRAANKMWYILNSSGIDNLTGHSDGISRKKFGSRTTDIPVVADYDGDGKADIAVRRPETSYWYVLNSSGVDTVTQSDDGITRLVFAKAENDIPVIADYDGDGKADFAVRRPDTAMWYVRNSSGYDFLTGNEDGITRMEFAKSTGDIPTMAGITQKLSLLP